MHAQSPIPASLHAVMNSVNRLEFRWLGRVEYVPIWRELQLRAAATADGTASESIFACEHEPVYTTGRRGIDTRVGRKLPAPVVKTDRGGEMTFHGPGQLMLYPVIDLRGRHIGIKRYVDLLEQSCIDLLLQLDIASERRCGFPGVWTERGKIAALGVRVSRGIASHGMALNIDVDHHWFDAINPCGLQSGVVNMAALASPPPLPDLANRWQESFQQLLATAVR